MLISINEEDFFNSLWFGFASGTQTFPRTLKSKDYYLFHIYRIFIGKIGELTFLRWLYNSNLLSSEHYNEHLINALSVYYGQSNVDSYDIKIKNYTIDIKTVPSFFYKYLIIPQDQWSNQKKDFYVAVAVNFSIEEFTKFCENLSICSSKKDIISSIQTVKSDTNAKIIGFLPRNSSLWKQYTNDKYCPEKKCVRVELSLLEPLENFIETVTKKV